MVSCVEINLHYEYLVKYVYLTHSSNALICYALRTLIPSGPPKLKRKTNQKGWFFRFFKSVFTQKIGLSPCYALRVRKLVVFYRGRDLLHKFIQTKITITFF